MLRRLNDNEGQNALLRARVERAERERREMQTRAAHSSQAGLAAATSADLQRQLDIARQQLAFKEQEVRQLKHNRSKSNAQPGAEKPDGGFWCFCKVGTSPLQCLRSDNRAPWSASWKLSRSGFHNGFGSYHI